MKIEKEPHEDITDQEQEQSQDRVEKGYDRRLPTSASPEVGHQRIVSHLAFGIFVIKISRPNLQENREYPNEDEGPVQLYFKGT